MVECPKCGGGAFLAEEELVQILENTRPAKILVKAIHVCRACAERFSRLVIDELESKRRDKVFTNLGLPPSAYRRPAEGEPVEGEGLKFF